MSKYIMDANILLRYLLNDIPHQAEEAEKYFQKAQQGEIQVMVPMMVILEGVFALTKVYKKSRRQVASGLRSLVTLPYLEVESREEILEALRLWGQERISFVDALLYVQAQKQGAKLVTFDVKLKRLLTRRAE